jgi:hypothetical protein
MKTFNENDVIRVRRPVEAVAIEDGRTLIVPQGRAG